MTDREEYLERVIRDLTKENETLKDGIKGFHAHSKDLMARVEEKERAVTEQQKLAPLPQTEAARFGFGPMKWLP